MPATHAPQSAAPEIHGHEVIAMMMTATAPYTRDSLRAAIERQFGASARFYTCSAAGMTPDQLIDFLAERGKFIPHAAGLTIDPSRVCQH